MISQSVLCVCFSPSLCCSCALRCFLSSLSCSVCPPFSRGSYRPKEISIARYRRNIRSALSCSPLICGTVSYGPCALNGLVESGVISTHPPFLPMSIFLLSSLSQFVCFVILSISLVSFLCSLQYQQATVPFIFLSVTPFRASILQDQQSAGELPLCKWIMRGLCWMLLLCVCSTWRRVWNGSRTRGMRLKWDSGKFVWSHSR